MTPDDTFDFKVLAHNESHWLATIHHMTEHCLDALFCTVKVQWSIPRLYIWQVGLLVKHTNLMPIYRRNATYAQYHPFHKALGEWKRMDKIFPLKKAKLWMYELPVAREALDDCSGGVNATRIYATHQLETPEEQGCARQMIYGCAQNITTKGYASYFHCVDKRGFSNGSSWKS